MPQTHFVVFGTGRSGSTLLADILNLHPQITCDREIFHRLATHRNRWQNLLRRVAPRLFIASRQRAALQRSGRSIYGFLLHTKLGAEQVRQPERLLQQLQRSGRQIIWLRRRDLFRQIISAQIANSTRRYHSGRRAEETEEDAPRLTIPVPQFTRMVNIGVTRHQRHCAMMARLPQSWCTKTI
jgi:LPS sulfotransferase NodH